LLKPKNSILGADISGKVEAVGAGVTQFKPGDEVFGDIFGGGSGGFAEYACANENVLALKPAGLSFDEAAAIPLAALTALQGLRDNGNLQPGQQVLINGASGGVGTYALQIAKAFGAVVTAVCSTRNLEMVRSLGADHVIDYSKEDFSKNGQQYDLIFAVNGDRSIFDYRRALKPSGRYVMAGGTLRQFSQAMLLGPMLSKADGVKMGALSATSNQKDLLIIKGLVEAGKVKPVIEKRYPLAETAEAMRYLGAGHARGKIVITVA
jgi:NADPH:quinone reductase-like Zn-dependent oxidoreductase